MKEKSNSHFVMKISMRTKLLAAFIFIATVSILVLGYISIKSEIQVIRQKVLSGNLEIANIVAQEIGQIMESAYSSLEATARIPPTMQEMDRAALEKAVKSFLEAELARISRSSFNVSEIISRIPPAFTEYESRKIERVFKTFLGGFKIFKRITILDREGREIYSTLPDPTDMTGKIWYMTAVAGGYKAAYSSDVYFTEGARPSLTVGILLRDSTFKEVGVIVAELDLSQFWPIVDRIQIGKTGVTYVVDEKGRVISHSRDRRLIGKDFSSSPLVRQALKGLENEVVEGACDVVGEGGVPKLAAHVTVNKFSNKEMFELNRATHRLPPLKWAVILEQDANEAYEDARKLRDLVTFVMLMCVIVAALMAVVMAHGFTNKLKKLAGIANTIAMGDLSKEVDVVSTDEIGELSHSFEIMRKNLNVKIEHLKTLYEVGQAISSVLNYEDLLKLILKRTMEIMKAEKGSLMLYDEETGKLVVDVAQGQGEQMRMNMKAEIHEGVAGRVYMTNKPMLIMDAKKSSVLAEIKGGPEKVYEGALLCVPLTVKERTLGVLNVSKSIPNTFDEKDLELFSALSVQAAIAIDNAILYRLAITDGLTKCYIHRYFQQRLDGELNRSARYNYPLSLLMLDIDHFKRFNDTYGHQVGDRVLKTVAKLLQSNVREVDIVARYGGEEFAIICPEKDSEAALVPAERIRKAVEEYEFYVKDQRVGITVSIGIASFPEDSREKLELIARADMALYYSKQRGRNRISRFCEIPPDFKGKGDVKHTT